MKIPMLLAVLCSLVFASPFADARSPAERTTSTPAARPIPRVSPREMTIRNRMRAALGSQLAEKLFADERFTLDKTLYIRTSPKPKPSHPQKLNYDYVFSDASIAAGKRFLKEHDAVFDLEEATFGIPRHVISSFLNIETQWGKNTGDRYVVVTLYTLAVKRPNLIRPGWAEDELMAFLDLCKENRIDLFSIKGSSRGAFGLGQFEPTSYKKLAVYCIGKGHPSDPFDVEGAVCSIGNYLRKGGWGDNESSQAHAIWTYNHDHRYVAAVMDYRDLMENNIAPQRYDFVTPRTDLAAIPK